MKYSHAVIYNGVLYPTGAEVPEKRSSKKDATSQHTSKEVKETPEANK